MCLWWDWLLPIWPYPKFGKMTQTWPNRVHSSVKLAGLSFRISADTTRWDSCSTGVSSAWTEPAWKRRPHRRTGVRDWGRLECGETVLAALLMSLNVTVPKATWDSMHSLFCFNWLMLPVQLSSFLSQRVSFPCYIYYLVMVILKRNLM